MDTPSEGLSFQEMSRESAETHFPEGFAEMPAYRDVAAGRRNHEDELSPKFLRHT